MNKTNLIIDVKNLKGEKVDSLSLPANVFKVKLIPTLLAQAVRVFTMNQRKNQRPVKTRANVIASKRKIYAQKGTGRARHGAVSAGIFVGGGKAHGSQGFIKRLSLTKKMKAKVLAMVLTSQYEKGRLAVVDKWPAVAKTQALELKLKKIIPNDSNLCLLVYQAKDQSLYQAGRNLAYLNIKPVNEVSFMDWLRADYVITDKESILELIKRGGRDGR